MTIVEAILASGLLGIDDVSKATHTSVACVRGWQASTASLDRDAEARLTELKAVVELARRVFDVGPGRLWLHSGVPALGDTQPLDLIAAGRWHEVVAVLMAFAEGVTA